MLTWQSCMPLSAATAEPPYTARASVLSKQDGGSSLEHHDGRHQCLARGSSKKAPKSTIPVALVARRGPATGANLERPELLL